MVYYQSNTHHIPIVSMDLNIILVPLVAVFGTLALIFGVLFLVRTLIRRRRQVHESLGMDLETVQVTLTAPRDTEPNNPDAWKGELAGMEQLLGSLALMHKPGSWWSRLWHETPSIVLELANPADSEEIQFYCAFPSEMRERIEKQIHSFFPQSMITKVPDYTVFAPGNVSVASVLGLKEPHVLPIKTYQTLGVDPLNQITNALSKLHPDLEGAALQLVLLPAPESERTRGRKVAQRMQSGKRLKDALKEDSFFHTSSNSRSLGDHLLGTNKGDEKQANSLSKKGEPVQLTPEEQELLKAIEKKSNQGNFRVNIRLIASAPTIERAEAILSDLENAFGQFDYTGGNHLTAKRRTKGEVMYDFIFRNADEENAVVLSVEELTSLYHFPIGTTQTPRIKVLKSTTAPPPVSIPKEGILFGYNDYRGTKTDIRITDQDRRRHLYVIGQTGVGKSNFLQELAKQDTKSKAGMCFIDPHGDAIEDILTAIPRERAEDVIIFDPSDVDRPIGLNMLEFDAAHPEQKTFVINEMIGIFDQLYDLKATGGPMFEQYMRNAMLLIMEDVESGSTLVEISRVLSDEEFRRYKLSKCKNQIVYDFWVKEAEKAGGEASLANMVPYITSKLTPFIANDLMRPIIAQQKSTIDFREAMDSGKIILVNLSKGKIGEINAKLLGMVIVGKILMAALSRSDIPEDQRADFYLYLDEFQNVTTNSIAQILSEARKYHLCMILAHQFIGQLKEEISKAVFGNVGSMVAFRVGPEDGEFLEKQFAPVFEARDLVNVDNYQAFAKLLINNTVTKPFNMKTYPPTKGDQGLANAFKELSRLRYGRDAATVNAEIMTRIKIAG